MAGDFRETLYTIDTRGNRRWVYSALVKGRWFKKRVIVAYALMIFYLALPWIKINGQQGVLLDFTNRKFIFLGTTFWATDTLFLVFLLLALALALFFFSAVLGRVWCGWACPETIFLEFLFRPIERLIEGSGAQRLRLDQQPWNFKKLQKKILKHSLCGILSWLLASTTLAYFIGREPLLQMMTDWPQNNLYAFSMTLLLMGLMAFQFGWFREQFCTIVCPYARFQSVLLDSDSLVVGYDVNRGEPRTKVKKGGTAGGDCVDCGLCVRVCPTGIDIRNGLQLECIHCTACMDACDSIMEQLNRDPGLIRYTTESLLAGGRFSVLRPRIILYAVLILLLGGVTTYNLLTRSMTEFQIIRGAYDTPFTTSNDTTITNHLHVRLANKSSVDNEYVLSISGSDQIKLVTPLTPFPVPAGSIGTTPIFLAFPKDLLSNGTYRTAVSVTDSTGNTLTESITVLGPDD